MFPKKDRVLSLLNAAIKEMRLLMDMTNTIAKPDDYVTNLYGMTVFRASGMSIQYITELFVKMRNLCGMGLFRPYKSIPWPQVFGMRNFLSHEYGDVDAEGIFNTVKKDIPPLLTIAELMLSDLLSGKMDTLFI